MLCDDCHRNEACIHITQISPEGKMDKNLCEECAARYQNFMPSPDAREFTVNDFLKGLFRQPQDNTFRAQLAPLLKRIHGSSTHSGKIPRRSGGVLVVRHEIAVLKEKLAEAVQGEAYEKAAEYRDKIRELERKIAAEEKGGEADGRA